MLKKIAPLIFLMIIVSWGSQYLLGCGGGGSESSSGNLSITLAWDPPTTKTDGSPLTDLAGYIVYYGTASQNYTNSFDVGNFTSASIGNIAPGTWYFAVTAYDSSGYESDFSEETSTQVN